MIRELMGPVIDIHGGGRDLMHPHHDNELVQSQAAADPCDCDQMHNSTDFVRWWVHLGFVNGALPFRIRFRGSLQIKSMMLL